MSTTILTLELRLEQDVVLARQRARQVAALLGFDPREQTALATAASEVARDVLQLGGPAGGRAKFGVEAGPPPALRIRIGGRGVPAGELQAIAAGRNPAPNGLGLGLLGARRLVDHLAVGPDAEGGAGAAVTLTRALPRRAAPRRAAAPGAGPGPGPEDLARIAEELAREAPRGALEEVRQQNRELLRVLDELRDRQAAVSGLNRELEETNRGVLALYAELDDRANALRRASDLKSRFLSDMSHEFRSPLNTILSLAGFLLDRGDGPLTAEQDKQVHFIRKAAEGLAELVNDLLDLAKVEAGKTVVRPASFEVADLFGAVRGMIRPLLTGDAVALVFDDPAGLPTLDTDEAKLAQILRNFLTNALKFTERGEVRVAAAAGPGDTVRFSVADTGIGIAPGDLGRIFEEFGQVDGPIQARVKGTGLGLPLSRRLAELLGGGVAVRSAPGVGSTFEVAIPRRYAEPGGPGPADAEAGADPTPGPAAGAGGGGRPGDPVPLREIPRRVGLPGPAGPVDRRGAGHPPGDPAGRRAAGRPAGGRERLDPAGGAEAARVDPGGPRLRAGGRQRPGEGAGAGGRRVLHQAGGPGLAPGEAGGAEAARAGGDDPGRRRRGVAPLRPPRAPGGAGPPRHRGGRRPGAGCTGPAPRPRRRSSWTWSCPT